MNLKKQLISMNYSKDRTIEAQFIVIHETANKNVGANAQGHFRWWNSDPNANSSVHFVVDDTEVVQLCELNWRCWHVGDGIGNSGITNDNSIGIEICVNSDGDYDKARANAIELVRYLLPLTGLTAEKVVRHYDATFKRCPLTMMNTPGLWEDFKSQIGGVSVLKSGSMGDEVKQLQSKLNVLGYGLIVDGDFGPATNKAVIGFQGGNGLDPDGKVGPATMAKLDEMIVRLEKPQEIDYKAKWEYDEGILNEIRNSMNKWKG